MMSAVRGFELGERELLERIAAGSPLASVLDGIVRHIEERAAGMSCSILLLDREHGCVRPGAAPTLPEAYSRTLDGAKIGPHEGSCGAAASLGVRVIAEDIATHPNWVAYRDAALSHGLRACWSSPIVSPSDEVLGTFAMYYAEPRGPTEQEIDWVDAAAHLASIAILRDRWERAVRENESRALQLARLYAVSGAISAAMVRVRDADALYARACEIAVENGFAHFAWVGVHDAATQRIVPAARSGDDDGYLDAIDLAVDATVTRHGLGTRAFVTGAPAVSNDLGNDPDFPFQREALSRRARSGAAFPLSFRGQIVGAFAIYADRVEAFGAEEIEALGRMANDLSFAVESARNEQERARLHRDLAKSEERLCAIVEQTPNVAIQSYDHEGRVAFFNEASARLFGWTPEAIGKTLDELNFSREDAARFSAALRDVARTGEMFGPAEFRFRAPDGRDGVLLSTAFRVPGYTEDWCFVCMDVDISARRRMEHEARTAEQLRSLVYGTVADAIFCLSVEEDEHFRFVSVNPAFCAAIGRGEHEIVGQRVDAVIPEPAASVAREHHRMAIREGSTVTWEQESLAPAGKRMGEVTVAPLFDRAGRCTHLVGTIRDITARKNAEAERRSLESTQRLQSLGTLARGIAHDFNNVLATIRGNVELALDDLEPSHPARESVEQIEHASVRAAQLVERILAFSRPQSIRREPVDVVAVIDEAVKLLRAALPSGVEIRTRLAPDTPAVLGSSTQIHQVVMNLVTNAAQAIGASHGVIEISSEPFARTSAHASERPDLADGLHARVRVVDDGCGMDPETVRRMFEPFFTTKPSGMGTGLGLSVVHGIVQSHEGAITVESAVGRGTTVVVDLPACRVAPPERVASRPPPKPSAGAEHVLYVDDEEALVLLITRSLTRLGYRVTGFTDPRRALEAFRDRAHEIDVLVTDVSMPGLDGPDLAQALLEVNPGLLVVLTTGHVRPQDVEAARRLGVADVLPKPGTPAELSERLHQLIAARAGRTS